ncbi:MAG TPA: DUF1343 domain-containing protein [Candidatus Babeliales bacterium]|nr:DUF1343 domain-containing protein [Candidatus Babeliales bacterium]
MKINVYLTLFSFFSMHAIDFKLGVENIPHGLIKKICPHKIKDLCMLGLITNQSGVDQKGNRTIDILAERGCSVRYIFTPEHGFTGISAERDVPDSVDKKTGIPILSLYGNGTGKMISADHMNNIDYLVFDIQDSGMRHYTYISTLLNTMKIAAEHDKPFVVLDRPNPLAGLMDGPLVQTEFISFISIAPIPLRHGMTIGEVAWYFNTYICEKPVALHVIKMKNYDRDKGFVGELMTQLSPNLQTLQSCYGYSFLGLLGEVEPFDVGVGTPLAFKCIMLPEAMKIDTKIWKRLAKILEFFGVKSFDYHHTNPKNKKMSRGLRLEFDDINTLHAFELFITILQFFKKENISFSFSTSFNKAVGTDSIQKLLAGTLPQADFVNSMYKDLRSFYRRAQCCFLYESLPQIASWISRKTIQPYIK